MIIRIDPLGTAEAGLWRATLEVAALFAWVISPLANLSDRIELVARVGFTMPGTARGRASAA